MEISYKQDYHYRYMIISLTEEKIKGYRFMMLIRNTIPGLLQVHAQELNGEYELCYDITSLEELSVNLNSRYITEAQIQELLLRFCSTVQEMEQYLLSGECLLLDPRYIFVSKDMEKIFFCCYPGNEETLGQGLNCLCRFILDHIDYDDRNCVRLAYELFQESLKETVSIGAMLKCIGEHRTEDKRDCSEVSCITESTNETAENNYDISIEKTGTGCRLSSLRDKGFSVLGGCCLFFLSSFAVVKTLQKAGASDEAAAAAVCVCLAATIAAVWLTSGKRK